MTILVTGFGPFDGGSNASQRLLEVLEERQERLSEEIGQRLALTVLPVDTEAAPIALERLIEALRPVYVLLCGQAAGRGQINLEQLAVNRREFRVPDAAGRMLSGCSVRDGGADSLPATWPDAEGAVAALTAARIPAVLSRDCGTHLCNQLLYAVLHRAAAHGTPRGAMFLHVPLTPEQVASGEQAARRHAACPSLPVSVTVRAVEMLLARLAATPELEETITA
jgi:pyroglutamyl-peptidase